MLAGLAFNWGALLGWSAVAGVTNWSVCLPLYAGGICWTLVYDTVYAHQVSTKLSTSVAHSLRFHCIYQDKRDDVNMGIRSTALLFSEKTRPILSALSASSMSLITYAGYLNGQGTLFYGGVALAAAQLARVVWKTDFDDRPSCWKGFVGCGWSGFWVWVGTMADYAMLLSSASG